MNEQLLKDIKHFEYVTKNRYEVMKKLLEKGYSENELIEQFNKYSFKSDWNGNLLGFLMIGLAIFIGFTLKSVLGNFNYQFDSSGDFSRLNEWVFKPFLILTLVFIGINTVINKGYINKNVKLIMIIVFSVFLITSVASNSTLSFLFGIIGILIFSLYKTSSKINNSIAELIIIEIQSGGENQKSVLRKINENNRKKWNGSSIFIFLLLSFCLYLNSPIDVTTVIVNQTENSTSYRSSIQNIDIFLFYGLKTLLVLSFLVSVFLNINIKKFKILLFVIMFLAGIYILATLLHSKFQVSIIPSLIIIITGIVIINKNKFY